MCAAAAAEAPAESKKTVWLWTENHQVMTTAVERGWTTFLFGSRDLGKDWSCEINVFSSFCSVRLDEMSVFDGLKPYEIDSGDSLLTVFNWFPATARINPLFIDGLDIFDGENKKVAAISQVSSPRELELIQPENTEAENIVIDFRGGWQVIPAENIVAAFQGYRGAVLAVSTNSTEAQVFLEALEQGLDGVVLKVDDMDDVIKLKVFYHNSCFDMFIFFPPLMTQDYFDRRNEAKSQLSLTKATISKVEIVGMGDRVCVDLCSIMRPGEGLLVCVYLSLVTVGSYARGMFLVHSECLETNYIASRPFRVNAGPVHAYVTVPGGKTSYLSELRSGKEVIVVDQNGLWRTAIVGRVKIESRPLILVEAKENSGDDIYSIFLQNAETVALITPGSGNSFSVQI
ncbi:hypothetical protein PR202_ga26908 [Eleusine coracana subsp. coracana]|uniref:3-dehydroquinate synthase n=1 Tax=Eleusine coracana subsp. coracana TaxID=191504 RepID=A0AAV5DFB9_ELECO|nr:hypothetical protein PR202_ga26908 [Eleusine coracana subsp. coracana]